MAIKRATSRWADEWERELDEVLGPDVVREYVHYDIALETEFEGALVVQCVLAIHDEEIHQTHFWARDASSGTIPPHSR